MTNSSHFRSQICQGHLILTKESVDLIGRLKNTDSYAYFLTQVLCMRIIQKFVSFLLSGRTTTVECGELTWMKPVPPILSAKVLG